MAKWGKKSDSHFLKLEVVIEKDEFKVVSAEVTTNEVKSANAVKELQH